MGFFLHADAVASEAAGGPEQSSVETAGSVLAEPYSAEAVVLDAKGDAMEEGQNFALGKEGAKVRLYGTVALRHTEYFFIRGHAHHSKILLHGAHLCGEPQGKIADRVREGMMMMKLLCATHGGGNDVDGRVGMSCWLSASRMHCQSHSKLPDRVLGKRHASCHLLYCNPPLLNCRTRISTTCAFMEKCASTRREGRAGLKWGNTIWRRGKEARKE